MAQKHVITPLEKNHRLVQTEMETPPAGKIIHRLKFTEEELKFPTKIALAVREQVTNLPLKVGNEVVVVTEPDQAVIEMLAICFLQRRFNECIRVTVRRESGEFFIPYITNLLPGEDDRREGMVDYNYSTSPCGGCSGNCSSC